MLSTTLRTICGTAVLLGTIGSAVGQPKDEFELKKVKVRDGIELSYIEAGEGTPIIFIHGSISDLYSWTYGVREFNNKYRAISYSRRYNYPNDNTVRPNHSTAVEGQDLAAFIKKLSLPKAHIVGQSYGAYTALHLAVKHPELVRTLVVSEPPLMPWLADLPGAKGIEGRRLLAAWNNEFIVPARNAISKGDTEGALEIFVDHIFGKGTYAILPLEVKALVKRNTSEFVAEVTSTEMFAPLTRTEVGSITVPTLMLSGANSSLSLRLTDDELERVLPAKLRKRVVIPDATHAMWHEKPDECRRHVLEFISGK